MVFCLSPYTFCLKFILFLPVWIQFRSGSTTLTCTYCVQLYYTKRGSWRAGGHWTAPALSCSQPNTRPAGKLNTTCKLFRDTEEIISNVIWELFFKSGYSQSQTEWWDESEPCFNKMNTWTNLSKIWNNMIYVQVRNRKIDQINLLKLFVPYEINKIIHKSEILHYKDVE